jgi:hypothetical protein
MVAAGGVVHANLRVSSMVFSEDEEEPDPYYRSDEIGWPYTYMSHVKPQKTFPAKGLLSPEYYGHLSEFFSDPPSRREFELTGFLDDLFIALLIMALVFGAWEGVLRVRMLFSAEAEEIESGV